ncbi:MAG: hypothetical protein ACYTGJ_06025 [Planctomycetota bacterium]
MSHSLFPPIAFLDGLQQSEVVMLTLVGVILVTAAFLFGRTWARWRGHRAQQERNERMFQIEKSLSDFYEHEKRKFLDEKAELEERIVRQEKQITELRRKAAGVTGKKDARADLMLQLLVENEQLQEKLFEENVRQKEERDRALGRELHQISYQRVLLSNLLSERGVQEAVVEILGDERRIEKLRAGTPRLDSLPTDAPAAPADPRTTQP